MAAVLCPICDAKMPGDWSEYPDYPFCSKRCRTIDLGRWLDGRYKIERPQEPDDVPTGSTDDEE